MNFLKIRKIAVVALLALFVITTGCNTPKILNGYVHTKYGETVSLKKLRSDYVSISSPLITNDPVPSVSTKKATKVLPLLFFWKFDYQTSCTLNSIIPVNLFTTAFSAHANSKGLKKKLDGATLEVTIQKIPTTFSFNDDYRLIWLLLYKIDWERVYLLPENCDLAISYRILKEGTEIKNGNVLIADPNKTKDKRFFQSVKKATLEYLTQYDENIKLQARTAVEKIIAEL